MKVRAGPYDISPIMGRKRRTSGDISSPDIVAKKRREDSPVAQGVSFDRSHLQASENVKSPPSPNSWGVHRPYRPIFDFESDLFAVRGPAGTEDISDDDEGPEEGADANPFTAYVVPAVSANHHPKHSEPIKIFRTTLDGLSDQFSNLRIAMFSAEFGRDVAQAEFDELANEVDEIAIQMNDLLLEDNHAAQKDDSQIGSASAQTTLVWTETRMVKADHDWDDQAQAESTIADIKRRLVEIQAKMKRLRESFEEDMNRES